MKQQTVISSTHSVGYVTRQMEKHACVIRLPFLHDSLFFDSQIFVCPREVAEEVGHLIVGCQISGQKLTGA